MLNIKMQPNTAPSRSPKISVVGVGGGGGNAVNNMIDSGLEGCEFVICNSDSQALNIKEYKGQKAVCHKIQLGLNVTGGLGAGAKPEIGRAAAEESLETVMKHLEGANMAFVTAGMGGGTGTGAAPVIARACREQGILTVGVVTKPFHFEGTHRMRMAEAGIEEMQQYVDTLIIIPNQNLFRVANEKTSFAEAFRMVDGVLQSAVCGVTDLMVRPGLVNLDFADIRTAMLEMGKAMMGTGEARGEKRAIQAAEAAINNPLLDDVSMKGAHGVIINITGGYDMTLFEADEACNRIRDEVDPEANIIFGATFDESLEGVMRVSILATGIEKESIRASRPQSTGRSETYTPRAMPQPAQYRPTPAVVMPAAPPAPSYTPSYSSAAPARQQAAPVAAASVHAPAPRHEPEQDMFEQSRYSEDTTGSSASSGGETGSVAHNTALRGTRYRDSFIPPAPAQYPSERSFNETSTRTTAQAFGTQGPTPQPQEARKRTPSLFERITGGIKGGQETEAMHHADDGEGAPMPQATRPFQAKLNIESPAAPSQQGQKNDLSIPAFLRRQAN